MIIAILELEFRPESTEQGLDVLARELVTTRQFDGNLGADMLVDLKRPERAAVYERWESREHDDRYREFRSGPGAIADLPGLLAERPRLTRYRIAE